MAEGLSTGFAVRESGTSLSGINYGEKLYDGSITLVNRHNLESLLTNNDILLVGEGNFTFTVALAAIRGGWNGIVSTRYEAVTGHNPRPQFDKVQEECIEFCRKNGKDGDEANISKCIEAIEKVEQPPKGTWLFGVDATKTPDDLPIQGKVVWFQCPWLPKDAFPRTSATLIEEFLQHMSVKQNEGDYVLIGITTKFPYVVNYNLQRLLGKGLSRGTDISGRYDFLGADYRFINKILKHGYHHTSCHSDVSIHEKIISDHLTLVFQRKKKVTIKSN